jgi:hypothetical protein
MMNTLNTVMRKHSNLEFVTAYSESSIPIPAAAEEKRPETLRLVIESAIMLYTADRRAEDHQQGFLLGTSEKPFAKDTNAEMSSIPVATMIAVDIVSEV